MPSLGVGVSPLMRQGNAQTLFGKLNAIAGFTMAVDPNDSSSVTTVSTKVSEVVDLKNGIAFAQGTDANRPTYGTWSDGSRCLTNTASTWMSAPDEAALSLGADSFLFVMAGKVTNAATYSVWGGNGIQASEQGVRMFNASSRGIAVYHAGDGTGPLSQISTTPVLLSDNTEQVIAWGVDRTTNEVVFGLHGQGAQRKAFARANTTIADNGNAFFLNGGADGVYRSDYTHRYVAMFRRTGAAFTSPDIVTIMALIATEVGL